jgi:hypothetical protein
MLDASLWRLLRLVPGAAVAGSVVGGGFRASASGFSAGWAVGSFGSGIVGGGGGRKVQTIGAGSRRRKGSPGNDFPGDPSVPPSCQFGRLKAA